ncbi:MAG: hypothetical protein MK110_07475 [Fuerstiella sp.]|nr:hypothetical protein [Fuerstiella sp.]
MFGSDYPFTTVDASVDGLRILNALLAGTALAGQDVNEIEDLIHRDSLAIPGIEI